MLVTGIQIHMRRKTWHWAERETMLQKRECGTFKEIQDSFNGITLLALATWHFAARCQRVFIYHRIAVS